MSQHPSFTLEQLAELTQSTLVGNPHHIISGVDSIESATSQDATFLANLKYKEALASTSAGVICIGETIPLVEGKNYLISENPSRAFQKIIDTLLITPFNRSGFTGIHPTAVIHPTAKLGKDVQIGPYVVVDQGSTIGDRTHCDAFVSIGAGTTVGSDCHIHPHVTIREKCHIGNRCVLQPGAVIGSCGFGLTTDAQGVHHRLDQLGIVVIEDDVDIGANTTIDRARFKQTVVSQGTKIDNLVQIAHNVILGPHNIIVSQSGIAGSAKTGRNVVLGGQAGVVGHLEIADGVMVATRGGVSKSVTKAGKYGGSPVMPLADYNRQQVQLRKIGDYVKQIEALQQRLENLETAFQLDDFDEEEEEEESCCCHDCGCDG